MGGPSKSRERESSGQRHCSHFRPSKYEVGAVVARRFSGNGGSGGRRGYGERDFDVLRRTRRRQIRGGPAVDKLEEDLNLAGMIKHLVALDDVGVVDVVDDLDFAVDLAADGVLVVAIYHLEGVESGHRAVEDLVDGATTATPDSVNSLQVGEVERR
ncbi:MAP kinase kinase 5 [Actinidia rufa]|uniref:MAP kinase kinase 5 n=1 Tax=Actinidia rufa TaxID=165716 RepID=A0A7J0FAY2_9ERIC|nr:MAP kinase kinase 5 [Actinidia rufa]